MSNRLLHALAAITLAAGLSSACAREPAAVPENPADRRIDAARLDLSPEALKAANIESAAAVESEWTTLVSVTGTVEANPERVQQATPLVSGRVESVRASVGDRVREGAVLATISSPEVAEMHGKLHEAETRLALAEDSLERIQRPESRAGVLQSQARLDEAEANLRRTRRLIDLGAAAGKDLTAAETAYTSAKAEYDYQNNISLSKEVQAARAEAATTSVEVTHLRNSLRALGAPIAEAASSAPHDTSQVLVIAPVGGTVIERLINSGAGIEPGKPIFTIADISTLWVIANVPEGRIGLLRIGMPAEILSTDPGGAIAGRIAYIAPVLDESTRTGRVRIQIDNPGERLKIGMFVEVSFDAPGGGDRTAIVIPEAAVQRMGERTFVFVPSMSSAGSFEVREIQIARDAVKGAYVVTAGLAAGERVVTRGSFVLKTQWMKGSLGEE